MGHKHDYKYVDITHSTYKMFKCGCGKPKNPKKKFKKKSPGEFGVFQRLVFGRGR